MDLTNYRIKSGGAKTKEDDLAVQIYEWSGKRIRYSMVKKCIKEKGYKAVWEIWSEVKQSDAHTPYKLFLWKLMKEKIVWKK